MTVLGGYHSGVDKRQVWSQKADFSCLATFCKYCFGTSKTLKTMVLKNCSKLLFTHGFGANHGFENSILTPYVMLQAFNRGQKKKKNDAT